MFYMQNQYLSFMTIVSCLSSLFTWMRVLAHQNFDSSTLSSLPEQIYHSQVHKRTHTPSPLHTHTHTHTHTKTQTHFQSFTNRLLFSKHQTCKVDGSFICVCILLKCSNAYGVITFYYFKIGIKMIVSVTKKPKIIGFSAFLFSLDVL